MKVVRTFVCAVVLAAAAGAFTRLEAATPADVLGELGRRACAATSTRATPQKNGPALELVSAPACGMRGGAARKTHASHGRLVSSNLADGTLVGRQRIAANAAVALDVVSYASTGLTVGGLLCYPNDGKPHSTVIHVPGGLGGVFSAALGDMVQTCINWAALHKRTAFAPSLRGNDGSEGHPELCLGEADDVVAAAAMLRTLDVTDADRLGVIGGSLGGCVALHAAPLIPNLGAVVAYVPPTSFKDLVVYHRTQWQPATELDCDDVETSWTIGGPALADALDSVICGHALCSDEDYLARSPLPYVTAQSAPTMVVSAERDNVVPVVQHLLWSLFRQEAGHPVDVLVVDKCDMPGTPPLSMDVHLLALRANHLLAGGPVSSGMLFLMARLDAIGPP